MQSNLGQGLLYTTNDKRVNQWKKAQYVAAFSAVALACLMVFAPSDQISQNDEIISLSSKKKADHDSLLRPLNQTGLIVTPTTNAFSIDLAHATRVGKVTVNLTSGTGASVQPSTFQVRVGNNENALENPKCQGENHGDDAFEYIEVSCDLSGRYVTVLLTDAAATLSTTDVQVWTLKSIGTEVPLLKQYVTQSSTFKNETTNATSPAYFSVNGQDYNNTNSQSNCSSTNVQVRPWWRAFLGDTQKVTQVRVFNNQETGAGNHNIKVYVGNAWDHTLNKVCSQVNNFENSTYIIADCDIKGKYVTVVADSDEETSLNICEVQVFKHTKKHD